MEKVRILWSGITGRTGKLASEIAKERNNLEIIAGICRNNTQFYDYDHLDEITEQFNVIVDFSHKDSFDKILNYALKVKKPIVIGTSGLEEYQLIAIEKASKIIPIFRGGNFRIAVKKFIDNVVEYAKNCNENEIDLIETHYKTKKKIPSDTAKIIENRVLNETGKKVNIQSYLEYDELINDYRVADLHCRSEGFKELAEAVLSLAVIMKNKKPKGLYNLDKIVCEISESKEELNFDK